MIKKLMAIALVGWCCFWGVSVFGEGTSFTYQGRLHDSSGPINGIYDFTFAIYRVSEGGSPFAGPVTNPAVLVTNGVFSVKLDFGPGIFDGNPDWFQMGVRKTGTQGPPLILWPRDVIHPTPYSVKDARVQGGFPSATFAGPELGPATYTNMAGFIAAAVALIFSAIIRNARRAWSERAALVALWIGTLTMLVSAALGNFVWDNCYATLVGLMAGAVWLSARRDADAAWQKWWNTAVVVFILCGAALRLGVGYFHNQKSAFYAGLAATLIALAFCQLCFRRKSQTVNTIILLLIGLPVADGALRSRSLAPITPENCQLYYSYNAAKGDPAAFVRWEHYYNDQFNKMGGAVFMPATNTLLPFRLRPNSHGTMMTAPVSINSLGFRGPEFSMARNGAYRIVALGESTTFGMTIHPQDKPWPDMLEQIIRQRLKTRRPVQVINAGVPAYTLLDNLYRLPADILPLHPDMIISYHGANGFPLIESSLLPALGPVPPAYEERPIRLAADVEHRVRMMLYLRDNRPPDGSRAPPSSDVMSSRYAAGYRTLINCAQTNRIRLALANFSMAVNGGTDSKVMDFYGTGYGAPYDFRQANEAHSLMVSQLAAEHPEVCFVDTHPHLDGEHEKFIDLIHLTNEGRQQLAENIFASIRDVLQKDLAQP